MKDKSKLKYTFSLIIVIIGILSLLGGTSYAILKGSTTSENEQVIKAGSVELKLTENFESISKKITVMSNVDGLLQEEVYDFNLRNIGSEPAEFKIKLVNEVPSDYTGKVLGEKYFKIGLEINGEEYGPISLEEANNIIDSDIIYEREMISYKMRLWLDDEKQEELSNMEDYKAFLKLKVEAVQRPEEMDNGKTTVFNYTGDVQEYKVTRDGYYYIELGGASGGGNQEPYTPHGAKTSGYIELEAGEKLYFYVGEKGTNINTNCRTSGYEFNGGGIALPASSGVCGATGGGATDVRLVSGSWDDMNSLISRIMVAGAGGGETANTQYAPGHGGTIFGVQTYHSANQTYFGLMARQNVGGAAPTKYSSAQSNGTAGSFGKGGYGGANASSSTSGGGSGGGAGYYGASGSSGIANGTFGSSGGSSYISGYAGVNSVEDSTNITHTNQTLHYSGKYFIGGKMIEGANLGNGYAKITYVDVKPKKKSTKLNNVRYIKDCSSYNSYNNYNHWIEVQAIKDGINVAKGKTVTGTTAANSSYPYSRITDGDISFNYSQPASESFNQCITVDLKQEYDLDEVAVWNYFGDQRSYLDNITYVSSDNVTWTEVIDEAVIQSSNGRRINAYTDIYNGYEQEALMLWYDGYANTGTTHNYNTTTWKDLSGNGYNGTANSAAFYFDYYLTNGSSVLITTTVDTNTVLANNKDWTMNAIFEIHTVPNTNTTYGNAGTIFGASYYGGAGIFWYRPTTSTGYILNAGKRSEVGYHIGSPSGTEEYAVNSMRHYITIVHDYTNKKLKVYDGNRKIHESVLGDNETYSNASTIGNVGIGKTQMLGGNYTASYTGLRMFKAQIYSKALTEDELTHNYNYDKQKFSYRKDYYAQDK